MKRTFTYIIGLAAIIMAASCAKEPEVGANDANKRYLEAWIHLYNQANNTDIKASGLGIYVLDETPGTGEKTVTNEGYAVVNYTITDLNGNINAFTDENTARQMGQYDTINYYGPQVWCTINETIEAGIQNALVGMKVGGRKKVLIPSWLMSYSVYATGEEYFKESTDYSNSIYDITVEDYTDSVDVWQINKIKTYITEKYGDLNSFSNDTTGFYYKQLAAPTKDTAFPSDTTIYINYTGKLLNGLVFDTSIEKVAKDNGLYSPAKTYGPVEIRWGESYTDLTMGSNASSVISGFAMTLWRMKAMESGIGIFYSPLGYGYSGSGTSIPGYSPLVFEIEIVENPE